MPSDPADPAPPLSDEELTAIRCRWWVGGDMKGIQIAYRPNIRGMRLVTNDGQLTPHSDLAALVSALAAERAKRTALENFIRGTHYNRTVIDGPSVCVRCGEPWPCSTFAALSEGNE